MARRDVELRGRCVVAARASRSELPMVKEESWQDWISTRAEGVSCTEEQKVRNSRW